MPKKKQEKSIEQQIYEAVNNGGTIQVVADTYGVTPAYVMEVVDTINGGN